MLSSAPDIEATKDRISDTVTEAWEHARDLVAPYLDTATARVVPALEEARTRLREDVTPEAKERATAALQALRGVKAQPARRWPVALGCLLLGTGAGIGVAMVLRPRDRAAQPPTPFPTEARATTTGARATAGATEESSPSAPPPPAG